MLDSAEEQLADPERRNAYPNALADQILITPLGDPFPVDAYQDLLAWANTYYWKASEELRALQEAVRLIHIRAIFMVMALGGPDCLPLRQQLAQRVATT